MPWASTPGAEMMNFGRFDLENGFHIDEVTVGYTTYGTLNEVRRDYKVPAYIFFFFNPTVLTPPPARPRSPPSSQAGDNAIIVGHSLTSNSMVNEWWGELLGAGDECSLTRRATSSCAATIWVAFHDRPRQ